jgi:hypothetical protein
MWLSAQELGAEKVGSMIVTTRQCKMGSGLENSR